MRLFAGLLPLPIAFAIFRVLWSDELFPWPEYDGSPPPQSHWKA